VQIDTAPGHCEHLLLEESDYYELVEHALVDHPPDDALQPRELAPRVAVGDRLAWVPPDGPDDAVADGRFLVSYRDDSVESR
jgi:hypothetical protein